MTDNKEQFKNYRVGEIIGRGRFAIVYKAEKLDVRKTVALKVLNPEFASRTDIREQFREQAKQQAKLTHPRLVRVEGLDEQHGQFFVAMEYMPLGSLSSWMTQKGVPTFRQAALIIADIAEALDYVHGQKLVHGDVKPSNILLMEDVSQKNVLSAKLSDLRLPVTVEIAQTVSENLVELTPEYISPEQAGAKPNTPLSDQYSLGIVAYEMLCGQPPFTGKNQVDLYIDHQRSRPKPLQQLNDQVTTDLEQVVLRALEKSPENRYASCGEFARVLRTAVAATEQKRLNDLLTSAEKLLDKQAFDTARTALKDALLIQPEDEKAAQLMARLEEQEGISKNYQHAVDALQQATARAQVIRKAAPDYPDDAHYLNTFAPPLPPVWKQLALRWRPAGQLAGFLLLFSLIFITGITSWIDVGQGQYIQATLIETLRTSTPSITPSPTPTLTPTLTATPTATNTLTSTPSNTPTPIGLLDFDIEGSWVSLNPCPGIQSPCWTDRFPGNYRNSITTGITAHEILVDRTWRNPYLFFSQKYQTETGYDFLNVKINGFIILRYSGSSDWTQIAVDLKQYKGKAIVIRFELSTDSTNVRDGVYVRDIRIVQDAAPRDFTPVSMPTLLPLSTPTPTP